MKENREEKPGGYGLRNSETSRDPDLPGRETVPGFRSPSPNPRNPRIRPAQDPFTLTRNFFRAPHLPQPQPLTLPGAAAAAPPRSRSRATFKPGVRCSRRRSEPPKREILGNLAHGCERRASVGNDIPAVQPVRDPAPRRCGLISGSEGLPKSLTTKYDGGNQGTDSRQPGISRQCRVPAGKCRRPLPGFKRARKTTGRVRRFLRFETPCSNRPWAPDPRRHSSPAS